jgi:Transposase DDE domain
MHTHASRIVTSFVEKHLGAIHASRHALWSAALQSVMNGYWLSLSRLARGLMGQGAFKAALKRMDRLIGCARVKNEACVIGRAMVGLLCRGSGPVVIAVDWSPVAPAGAFVELRAMLVRAGMGRGLTLCQQVHPLAKLSNPRVERRFLNVLHAWMPKDVSVVILTDAGFHNPWFAHVERLGWGWVGRVRAGGGHLSQDQEHWQDASNWFVKATRQARRLSGCWLTKRHRLACDVVLYRRRVKGGKRYGRAGHKVTPKARQEARRSAHEPWLLTHSPSLAQVRADQIVAWYSQRMQIEETFRDHKSPVFGLGLRVSQSRSANRLLALLLIGSVAAYLLWHIGQLAEAEGLHRRFKATTRSARELSLISLGLLVFAMHLAGFTQHTLDSLYDRLEIQRQKPGKR